MVCVRIPGAYELVLLVIEIQVVKGAKALSHLSTFPDSPLMVSVFALVPEQIDEVPLIVPEIVPLVTETLCESVTKVAHDPLLMIALNAVV